MGLSRMFALSQKTILCQETACQNHSLGKEEFPVGGQFIYQPAFPTGSLGFLRRARTGAAWEPPVLHPWAAEKQGAG